MISDSSLAGRIRGVFGLDVRSLAAFRVAVGCLLLVDVAVRCSDFAAMYGPGGFAPASAMRSEMRVGQWSLYVLNESAGFQAGLFAVTAAFAAALAVGYRTRLATIACWTLTLSLHARLPGVINAGDTLLRLMLFWSMFLPLGAAWSLDAQRRGPAAFDRVVSVASVAFILQLSIVYWLAGWAKWNDDWLHDNALANIFGFNLYGTGLGRELLAFPGLTDWMSKSVVWFELLGPCLLYVPIATARIRVLLVLAFWAFHVGIAATITLGLFSYVAIAAWMALLPGEVWESLGIGRRRLGIENLGIPPLLAARKTTALRSGDFGSPVLGCSHPFNGGGFMAACCLLALGLVIYWNVINVTHARLPGPVHRSMVLATHAAGLQQSWALFGRAPKSDRWFVYSARLKNGQSVDLLTGEPAAAYERPPMASQQFSSHRWRKLHWRLSLPMGKKYRQPLAEFFCRRWNASHGTEEQVVHLDLFAYLQPLERGRPADAYTRVNLARVSLGGDGGAFAEALRELDGP